MLRKIVLFLSFFFFISNVSFATRISREEKSCPLCGTKFMAEVVWSTNNFGGTDHDLCPHARGASPLSSYIWGCPYCNFCGFSEDFSKRYTEEEKTKITNWLKENYPPTIEKPDQEEPKKNSEDDDILPVSDPKKLHLLVEGLEEAFPAARVQCYKELVRRTDIKKMPDAGLSHDIPRGEDRQSLISFYSKWLEENISKLAYDEKTNKFIIRK